MTANIRVSRGVQREDKLKHMRRYAIGSTSLDLIGVDGQDAVEARYVGAQMTGTEVKCHMVPDVAERFTLGSETMLPFTDNSFDTTLAFDVLERVSEEAKALAEIARVTRQRLILFVPSDCGEVLRMLGQTHEHSGRGRRHEYGADQLIERLAGMGYRRFRVLRVGTVAPDPMPDPGLRSPLHWVLRALRLRTDPLLGCPCDDNLLVADKLCQCSNVTVHRQHNPSGYKSAAVRAKSVRASNPRWTLITPHFWPEIGGIQEYLAAWCRALGPHRVAVIAPAAPDSGPLQSDAPSGVDISRVPKLKRLRLLMTAAIAAHRFWKHPGGLILGMADSSGLIAIALRRFLGGRYIVCTYGKELLGRSGVHRWCMRLVLSKADCVVAISGFTAGLAVRVGAIGVPIVLVRPTFQVGQAKGLSDALRVKYGLSGARIILTVGRLEQRKGHETMLRALPGLRAKAADVRYVIVGDGPERKRIEALVSHLGLENVVTLTGHVDSAELAEWYELADVFAMVSSSDGQDAEGFGIVYLEASAAGKPIVAGRGGGVGDAVIDGVTGISVDPANGSELVSALQALLTDRSRAAEMGIAGRRWVTTQFAEYAFRQQVTRMVEDLETELSTSGVAGC